MYYRKFHSLIAAAPMLLLAACTMDAYEKGDGEYSLMTAELVEAHVGSDKVVDYVETDQGERLSMDGGLTAKWIQTADTTYRAYLYYNTVGDGRAEAVSFGRVGVLMPLDSIKSRMKTDPLYVESAWKSRNGRYVNLRLRVLTGSTEDKDAQHVLGLLRDTLASTATNTRLVLYHDQGGRPEYYSSTVYVSVPLSEVSTDSVTIEAETYSGRVAFAF